MKPVDISPATPLRKIGNEISRARANEHSRPAMAAAAEAAGAGMVATTGVLWSGERPPVDNERVAEIRNALREGRYPLVPARLADQMIAAGFVLIDGRGE